MAVTPQLDPELSLVALAYHVALDGDVETWELKLPNARRLEPSYCLNPWSVSQCMDHAILTSAKALGIEVPEVNPFFDLRLHDGPNLVATTHLSEDDWRKLYWATVHYIKTGNLPVTERTKRCPGCGFQKLVTNFHLRRTNGTTRQAYCSQCMAQRRHAKRLRERMESANG